MALFRKNPNETAYTEGKKHWADVIKNSGSGELLLWRQPEEDFNTNSTLIVMPGEVAVFVKGGIIEQVFENGTYQLSTENYPFISRLRNAFTGGISTFNCVVYFFRKADSKEIKWGTDSPIQVRDKVWNIRTDARVRGSYKIRIDNPAVFLEKMVGNNITSQHQSDLEDYFYNELRGEIKSVVSRFLNGLEQELIGIDAYLTQLSKDIAPEIDGMLSNYGLKCTQFVLSGIDIDKTKYDILDQAQMDYVAKVKDVQASKAGIDILGNDWANVQNVEIQKKIAENPNGIASAGAGLGMGIGAAATFGAVTQQMVTPIQQNEVAQDPVKILEQLKSMLDAGLIEKSEYDAKKSEILSRM